VSLYMSLTCSPGVLFQRFFRNISEKEDLKDLLNRYTHFHLWQEHFHNLA